MRCEALWVCADGVVQEVASGDMDILAKLRDALMHRLGQERYALWFGARTRLLFVEGILTVEVASPFFQEWLRTNFGDVLRQGAAEVLQCVDGQGGEAGQRHGRHQAHHGVRDGAGGW